MDVERERKHMVQSQIIARGITDPKIITAMQKIPRHLFVPEEYQEMAYEDHPVAIGCGQTISQPYIVALMLEAVHPHASHSLLEIGSGSGYLLAIASLLFEQVVGIERVEELYQQSLVSLEKAAVQNVRVLCADGYEGVEGPFDAIIVSCSCPEPPPFLLEQLKEGGILAAPIGDAIFQELLTFRRVDNQFERSSLGMVRFVPLISPHIPLL